MDLATIIGIIGGFGVVVAAIFLGGTISQFIDVPSMLIVISPWWGFPLRNPSHVPVKIANEDMPKSSSPGFSGDALDRPG